MGGHDTHSVGYRPPTAEDQNHRPVPVNVVKAFAGRQPVAGRERSKPFSLGQFYRLLDGRQFAPGGAQKHFVIVSKPQDLPLFGIAEIEPDVAAGSLRTSFRRRLARRSQDQAQGQEPAGANA